VVSKSCFHKIQTTSKGFAPTSDTITWYASIARKSIQESVRAKGRVVLASFQFEEIFKHAEYQAWTAVNEIGLFRLASSLTRKESNVQ
jgi:hypothetical protein